MPTPNLIGQQIHHYEILSHLGGGGMGVVYKAKDTKLGRTVALKFLAPQLTSDPDLRRRFVQEAKAASALDHPNIGYIHEINETDDGQLFIAMAYYEGETLKDKIANGPIPADQAIDYAAQIAKGLAKAHEADIVHRDIKPANIIITKDDTVKIVDFGLAKMTGETQLTKTGSTIGTIAYMSPEQLKGEEVDHRTDIWSLGVVLYEMVMGERPYKGEFEHAVIYGILHEQVHMKGVPGEARSVLEEALQKDPEERLEHISDVVNELSSGGMEVVSSRWVSGVRKWNRNSFLFFYLVAGVVLLLGIGIWVLNGGIEPAPVQSPVETRLTFSGNAYRPAISPDGEIMAYVEAISDSTGRILLQETSGGTPYEIVSEVEHGTNLQRGVLMEWSPDGKLLGIRTPRKGLRLDYEFHLYTRLGQFVKSIPVQGHEFTWSPDASSIVSLWQDSIRFIDVHSLSQSNKATPYPGYEVAMSPNGKHLLLNASGDGKSLSLWLFNKDVSGDGVLIYGGGPDQLIFNPRWGKDSQSVYFFVIDGLNPELRRLPVSPSTGMPVGSAETIYTYTGSDFVYRSSIAIDVGKLLYNKGSESVDFTLIDLQNATPSEYRLTDSPSLKWGHWFSPDGEEIFFLMQNRTGVDLYAIELMESIFVKLRSPRMVNWRTSWFGM